VSPADWLYLTLSRGVQGRPVQVRCTRNAVPGLRAAFLGHSGSMGTKIDSTRLCPYHLETLFGEACSGFCTWGIVPSGDDEEPMFSGRRFLKPRIYNA
jgi:hypothetical protein